MVERKELARWRRARGQRARKMPKRVKEIDKILNQINKTKLNSKNIMRNHSKLRNPLIQLGRNIIRETREFQNYYVIVFAYHLKSALQTVFT